MNATVKLSDGRDMPPLGLGVWQASDEQARQAVKHAVQAGYRSVDTAAIYGNETGVGLGLADSGVPRSEIFLTTKVWNTDQGADSAVRALDQSLSKLATPYVDLLLIHWPAARLGRYLETWKAMIGLRKQGLARSIGVSNFAPEHLRRIVDETGVTPVLNQIELHPYLQQRAWRQVHKEMGILTECWSPLAQGQALKDPVLLAIAEKHGKSTAQVILRWHLDNGFVAIPKSVTPSRIESNFNVFDFTLDNQDLAEIGQLDQNRRIGPDPDTFA